MNTIMKKIKLLNRVLPTKNELPTEYQAVEYIERVDREAYIDTNFLPSNNTDCWADFQISELDDGTIAIFGSRLSSNSRQFLAVKGTQSSFTNKYVFRYGNNYTYLSEVGDLNRHTIELNKNDIYFDNEYKKSISSSTVQSGYTMYLFGYSEKGTPGGRAGKLKIFSCYIKEDGILVRNYIPCYRKSDGVIGMYDLCENICTLTNSPFYTNAGTGTFLKGEDT